MYGTCLGGCTLGFAGHSCEQYERINMALHQPTFQLNPVYTSRNLVDGKKTDFSLGGNQCTTTAENKAFAMWWVDLKNTRRIERIRVYSRRDDKQWGLKNEFTSRFRGFTIVVSNTTEHKNGVVCYNDRVYLSNIVPSVVDVFCSAIGRYVIYYNERFSDLTYPYGYSKFAFVDLCEVEVYGCPVLEYGFENPKCTVPCAAMCKSRLENLSYKKNTWQHTTRSTGYSSRAVDGLYTDRSYSGNQCAATGDSYFALWWVDLGHVSRIDHIVMYFRTDNEPWGYSNGLTSYFLGFSLYISNTTNRLDGVRCFHDKTYTKQTIPDHVSIDCPYVGQYVFYYNERFPGIKYPEGYSKYAYGDLCEVEVYGCPSPVAEVPQCSDPCPVDCEQCYPGTGWCTKCKPGFEGAACEIICHAKTDVYVSQPLTYGGSKYDAMFSSTGLFFPKPKTPYPFTHIILQLYGKNSNIAKVSLHVEKASNVTVSLYDSKRSYIKRRMESSRELQSFNVNIVNNFNSFVTYIDIIVHTFEPFIISNLRLPLRECVKNIKEKIPCNDQPPEFLRQAMQGGKM
ncbi:uncharacterized protein LOC128172343 [Crassostrea angulata]|uniref:uncharacterized protein LOC128172343 n=1 Tax=Magallana angulata TaxID=2784310 RepID=UPI0022B0E79F|nr:uncharacterized protein LOC128172343 [Crassostrea angulata]